MANFALIGGSGLDQLSLLEGKVIEKIDTPYGKEPVEICRGVIDGLNIVFLSRHGTTEKKPPHMINYRANIWALAQFEPKAVIALASVGAVLPEDDIGAIAVPDQIMITPGVAKPATTRAKRSLLILLTSLIPSTWI